MSDGFPCNRCGATLLYDASVQALHCPYCGTLQDPGSAAVSAPIREIPLEEGLARAARGMGTPVSSVQCTTCGAVVHGAESSTTCAFCRSPVVFSETDPNLIRPESLVPFLLDRDSANQRFAQWLHGLWFRPSSLKLLARAQTIEGLYVPFWTFDAHVHSAWTARAGYYYYETEHYTARVNGRSVQRSRQVRHTRWRPASGSREDRYDDVLLCASKGLAGKLVQKLATFDTRQLVPYDPSFLAGWRAEGYSIDLYAGWAQSQAIISASQRQRCAGDVPGDTHDSLRVNDTFAAITFKHVLLPIWIGVYRHANEPYQFMVNGQTGEVVGKAPWSFWKIFACVLLFFLVPLAVFAVAWFFDNYSIGF